MSRVGLLILLGCMLVWAVSCATSQKNPAAEQNPAAITPLPTPAPSPLATALATPVPVQTPQPLPTVLPDQMKAGHKSKVSHDASSTGTGVINRETSAGLTSDSEPEYSPAESQGMGTHEQGNGRKARTSTSRKSRHPVVAAVPAVSGSVSEPSMGSKSEDQKAVADENPVPPKGEQKTAQRPDRTGEDKDRQAMLAASVEFWTPTPIPTPRVLAQAEQKQSSAAGSWRAAAFLLLLLAAGAVIFLVRKSRAPLTQEEAPAQKMETRHAGKESQTVAIAKPEPVHHPHASERAHDAQPAPEAAAHIKQGVLFEAEKPSREIAGKAMAAAEKKVTAKRSAAGKRKPEEKSAAQKRSNVISLAQQKKKLTSHVKTRKKGGASQAEIVPFKKKANG